MKKILALLLALMMLFSVATVFVGCEDSSKKKNSSSSKDEEEEEEEEEDEEDEEDTDEEQKDEDLSDTCDETENPESENEEPVATDDKETEPEETEPEVTESEETEPEETEPEEVEPGEEVSLTYIFGQSNGTNYENDFVGFSCELPEGWKLYNQDEILLMNGISSDFSDQEILETLDDATVVYLCYAVSDNGVGSDNLNINVEKADPTLLESLDMEENLNNIAPALQDTMLSMGLEYYDYVVGTELIGGKNVAYMSAECGVSDMVMYQFITMIKCDGYVCCITLTTCDQNTMDQILDGYSFF